MSSAGLETGRNDAKLGYKYESQDSIVHDCPSLMDPLIARLRTILNDTDLSRSFTGRETSYDENYEEYNY